MHTDIFIQDMAVIMLVAGIVTIVFNRLNQPVVLGYIAAGVIIGPHTPPIEWIQDKHTIAILAELGVVFLMFSLGLEFSLRKVAKVGATALIAALAKLSIMIWLGYQLGQGFGWKMMDSLFLGTMLAISSTTIIVKALTELGMKQRKFAQLIFGILIVEDILAIGIIALLSGIATTGSIQTHDIFLIVGKLSLFIIVALVLGLLTIPRLLAYVATFKSNEMLLVTVLGLCFGFCLLVIKLDYSVALGSFMVGAIIAEAKPLHLIEKLIEPMRDTFCAIFFVAIGMLFDPKVLVNDAWPILIITLVLLIGKVLASSLGVYIAGERGKTSIRVGMGLVPIGEFSFIIAGLGVSLHVTSPFLYPIIVAVSAITTLLTPYLIRLADPLSNKVSFHLPTPIAKFLATYTNWLAELQPKGDGAMIVKIIAKISLQIIVNCALVAVVFLAGAFIATTFEPLLDNMTGVIGNEQLQKSVVCGVALLISLPFLIAAYRKLKALAMIFAEMVISHKFAGKQTYSLRKIIFETLPILVIIGIMSLIFSFSSHILPSGMYLSVLLLLAGIVTFFLWKPCIIFQSWLQVALFSVMAQEKDQ